MLNEELWEVCSSDSRHSDYAYLHFITSDKRGAKWWISQAKKANNYDVYWVRKSNTNSIDKVDRQISFIFFFNLKTLELEDSEVFPREGEYAMLHEPSPKFCYTGGIEVVSRGNSYNDCLHLATHKAYTLYKDYHMKFGSSDIK